MDRNIYTVGCRHGYLGRFRGSTLKGAIVDIKLYVKFSREEDKMTLFLEGLLVLGSLPVGSLQTGP